MFRLFLIFFIHFVIFSCNNNKTSSQLQKYFYEKKPEIDLLLSNLKKDSILDSLFRISPDSGLPKIKDLYPKEYKILQNCGFLHASSHVNAFAKGTRWYYFETNWPSDFPIFLSYNTIKTYDSSERKKGFYRKDQYLNEWWGLGDGFQMLRLVKTID